MKETLSYRMLRKQHSSIAALCLPPKYKYSSGHDIPAKYVPHDMYLTGSRKCYNYNNSDRSLYL
ncbi:MAG: hypothetical protein F6K35_50445 [Okeania sp. SIO2H7]|nr:hypothetical protein [Okeania sp. SIO2H7]